MRDDRFHPNDMMQNQCEMDGSLVEYDYNHWIGIGRRRRIVMLTKRSESTMERVTGSVRPRGFKHAV